MISRRSSEKGKQVALPRMKATQIKDEISKLSDTTIVSLSGGDELPEGVEDIVEDFGKIQKGTIKSAICPLTLSLKKETHKKKLKLTTLKSVKNLFDKLGGDSRPFVRFERIQFLYLPLMSDDDEAVSEMKVTVSLEDMGKEKAGNKSLIQEQEIRMDEMALVELSMDFFVRKEDLDQIVVNISASDVPVSSRAYGSLFMAFFVHEEAIPLRVEKKKSTIICIDPSKAPKDLNKKNVLGNVSKVIQDEIKTKRESIKKKARENNVEKKKRLKGVRVERESSRHSFSEGSSDSGETFIAAGRRSVDAVSRYLSDLEIHNERTGPLDAMMNRPGNKRNCYPHFLHHNLLTALDTGSGAHYFYRPRINADEEQFNFGGVECLEIEKGSMNFKTGSSVIHLSEVNFFSNLAFGINILSYSKLKADGIIDDITSAGNGAFLMKGDEIVLSFDSSNEGRIWLKDDAYDTAVISGGPALIERLVREKKSLNNIP
uniref:Movement protein n=1 Tax=Boraginaceae associated ophiovirus TaxID=2983931 RepID=A0A9N6YJZ3_9VIRU|nr:TPA_asm: movement protein [Boraginaceae associated ophiovirus]